MICQRCGEPTDGGTLCTSWLWCDVRRFELWYALLRLWGYPVEPLLDL